MSEILILQISPEKFRNEILQDFKKEIDLLKKEFKPKEPLEYLTRNEVAEYFKVDISTVHNWTKKGKIKSYGISGRVYYKRQEIEGALTELK